MHGLGYVSSDLVGRADGEAVRARLRGVDHVMVAHRPYARPDRARDSALAAAESGVDVLAPTVTRPAAGGRERDHRCRELEAADVAPRALGAVHAALVRARAAAARGRHRVARGAAGTQCTREGGPAVVLQWAQPGFRFEPGQTLFGKSMLWLPSPKGPVPAVQ